MVYPALTGSKTLLHNDFFKKLYFFGSTARKSPIGSTNNQRENRPLIEVPPYKLSS